MIKMALLSNMDQISQLTQSKLKLTITKSCISIPDWMSINNE